MVQASLLSSKPLASGRLGCSSFSARFRSWCCKFKSWGISNSSCTAGPASTALAGEFAWLTLLQHLKAANTPAINKLAINTPTTNQNAGMDVVIACQAVFSSSQEVRELFQEYPLAHCSQLKSYLQIAQWGRQGAQCPSSTSS